MLRRRRDFDDVLALTRRPLVVSHTGFRGQCDTPRNVGDALMRELAKRGSLIGVGYWDGAVCDVSPRGIVAAIRYGIDLVGEDHVALGSDYDRATEVPFDTAELAVLTQTMLDDGFTDTEIRKVMGGNMQRFLAAQLPPQGLGGLSPAAHFSGRCCHGRRATRAGKSRSVEAAGVSVAHTDTHEHEH